MNNIYKFVALLSFLLISAPLRAEVNVSSDDIKAIKQAALNYIESQHQVKPENMKKALHKKLAKRTFWRSTQGEDYVMETSYETMIKVAASYNEKGDKFPKEPKKTVKILDADERVASIKLTADDWIDYMHLIKDGDGQWKIINVLWRYHDISKHVSTYIVKD
ncbi:MAG: hypothetical protein ACI9LM_003874 [Alteromonadaceae bacterium]|jgi:hypothetical protein